MKVSRVWLQEFFDPSTHSTGAQGGERSRTTSSGLPDTGQIADALTFHSSEIESIEGEVLDVKVLPNRAADLLSHRGIAKELSAILNIPLAHDPLKEAIPPFPKTSELVVTADSSYVMRHTGALIRGVKVAPSPEWLKNALELVGQRSINNVVDALNYVMLNIGQPSGAFDLKKLTPENGVYKIDIRRARAGENITTLTGEKYQLSENMFAFTSAVGGMLMDIAGIKGGLDSGITDATTDIFLSVGNYDATLLRKTCQTLKLFTEASQRYQNHPSPELTSYGMRDLLALLTEVAGGEVVGVVDIYPTKQEIKTVSVSAEKVSRHLGISYTDKDISDVFDRLKFSYAKTGDAFVVTPPFERRDVLIPEDLVEEVGRIIGYDKVPATALPAVAGTPDQARFRGIERMKDELVKEGYIEVSTQSFERGGDVYLANPLDGTKPALRPSLETNLKDALLRARLNGPLVLPPNEIPKLFEVGTVFPKDGEYVELRMSERVVAWGEAAGITDNLTRAKLEEYGKEYVPQSYMLGSYQPFSVYPFIARDIAFWTPGALETSELERIIKANAGSLLVRCDLFDTFEKDGKTSYAFRLIFQSYERTLSDSEVNTSMEKITHVLTEQGWIVR